MENTTIAPVGQMITAAAMLILWRSTPVETVPSIWKDVCGMW